MPIIKTTDIKVGSRFRKKFEDIDKLAESISEVGLIEPIVIDEDNRLIAGERRLKAHKLLKKETIYVRVIRGKNTLEKKEIELEENIQRKSFTWQEEVSAKAELHKLKQKIHGAATKGQSTDGWGIKETAESINESLGTVSMDIQLANGIKNFPELSKEKSKTTAFKKLKFKQKEILQAELAKRMRKRGVTKRPDILCGDCLTEMAKMEDESFDLVLTDPPFGIDVGNAMTFKRMTITDTFKDEEYETFNLLDKSFAHIFRLLKENRHLLMFCAINKFNTARNLLIKHGFSVHHIPIIWDKGSGSYPSQSTEFVNSYECFLHGIKGARKLNGTPRNVFPIKRVPPNKKIHPTEKPTELLRDLISLTTNVGEKVLDPFCGSGATLEAAKDLERFAIGIELDPIRFERVCRRIGGSNA